MSFRDYILSALEAYGDSTKFIPLDRDSRQALGKMAQQMSSLSRTLRDLARPGSRAETPGTVSRVPVESEAELVSVITQGPLAMNGDTPPAADTPAPLDAMEFDPAKWKLGKLCIGKHPYHSTAQTLYRLPKMVCPQCDAARARDRRAAKRQAKAQQKAVASV
jgi:hypothetical protein